MATRATTALLFSLAFASASASDAHAGFTIVGTVAGAGHLEVYVQNVLVLSCTTPADTPDSEVNRCASPQSPNGEYTWLPSSDAVMVAGASASYPGWEFTKWGCPPPGSVQMDGCLTSPTYCSAGTDLDCPWISATFGNTGLRFGIHAEFTDVAAPGTQGGREWSRIPPASTPSRSRRQTRR